MNAARRIVVTCTAIICAATACGFPREDEATPLPDEELPTGLRPGTATESTAPAQTERATIWLVEDGALVATLHDVVAPASVDSVMEALLMGANEADQERGLRSALPDPAVVVDVEPERGVAVVELAPQFAEISSTDQLLAVGQVVLTMTGLPGVGGVEFTLDGAPVAVPIPGGESSEGRILRDQFSELAVP